jgi:hypothetical protein
MDGLTWQAYAADLEQNLTDLHARVHRGHSACAKEARVDWTVVNSILKGRRSPTRAIVSALDLRTFLRPTRRRRPARSSSSAWPSALEPTNGNQAGIDRSHTHRAGAALLSGSWQPAGRWECSGLASLAGAVIEKHSTSWRHLLRSPLRS